MQINWLEAQQASKKIQRPDRNHLTPKQVLDSYHREALENNDNPVIELFTKMKILNKHGVTQSSSWMYEKHDLSLGSQLSRLSQDVKVLS